jgi:hypothetical protein
MFAITEGGMSKSNDAYNAYKDFIAEDQAAFRQWLRTNVVIASLFIVMFVILVLSGRATKAPRTITPAESAMNADLGTATDVTMRG